MINPLPVMSRASRWWFLRKMARLLTSGLKRVEVSQSNNSCILVWAAVLIMACDPVYRLLAGVRTYQPRKGHKVTC